MSAIDFIGPWRLGWYRGPSLSHRAVLQRQQPPAPQQLCVTTGSFIEDPLITLRRWGLSHRGQVAVEHCPRRGEHQLGQDEIRHGVFVVGRHVPTVAREADPV